MRVVLVTGVGALNSRGELVGESVLIEGGVIRGVGPRSRFMGSYSVELRFDGYIAPGIHDSHLHLLATGLSLSGVDLRGVGSIEELRARVSGARGPVVYGRGWDQENFREARWPARWDIDEATGGRPAILVRICGHAALLNTRAMEIARPWEAYPEFVERRGGSYTGIVYESAVSYSVERLMESADPAGLVSESLRALAGKGIVGASSMSCRPAELRALEDTLARLGMLPLRVACYPDYRDWRPGYSGSVWLDVPGFKVYADGSLGARTAYLREPYSDEPSTRGSLLAGAGRLAEYFRAAARASSRAAVHAIGDAALDEVLEAARAAGRVDLRIEHVSVAWDEQLDAMAEMGARAVVQPMFRVDDWWIDRRLGPRASLAYRFRSMVLRGIEVSLSSDSPVEPFDPGETFRASLSECSQPSCLREEALEPGEALRSYTLSSARASSPRFSSSGELEKGFLGDLTILASNPVESRRLEPIEGIVGGVRQRLIVSVL